MIVRYALIAAALVFALVGCATAKPIHETPSLTCDWRILNLNHQLCVVERGGALAVTKERPCGICVLPSQAGQ